MGKERIGRQIVAVRIRHDGEIVFWRETASEVDLDGREGDIERGSEVERDGMWTWRVGKDFYRMRVI